MPAPRTLFALAAALLASPTLAATFEDVAAKAQKLDALAPFLDSYVGRCGTGPDRVACERHVATTRKQVAGKAFVVRVQDAAGIVRPTMEGNGFVLLLTPFVDGGGGFALTHGAPTRQDSAGNPLLPLVPVRGRLPPGTLEMEFQAPFRTGAIDLEIVFRPEKAWKLKRKGEGGSLEGLAARFLAVRVVDSRTGKEIASRAL